MITYEKDGKTYELRNLQEQVRNNLARITDIERAGLLLAELGIKLVGRVNTVLDLPSATTYTGSYGDAYAVGTSTPYTFYIFSRPFEGETQNHWFSIGLFPAPGSQGPQGPAGAGIDTLTQVDISNPTQKITKITSGDSTQRKSFSSATTGTFTFGTETKTVPVNIMLPIVPESDVSVKINSLDSLNRIEFTAPQYTHNCELNIPLDMYGDETITVKFAFDDPNPTSFSSTPGQTGWNNFCNYLANKTGGTFLVTGMGLDVYYDGLNGIYPLVKLTQSGIQLEGFSHQGSEYSKPAWSTYTISRGTPDWEYEQTYFIDVVNSRQNRASL